MFASSMLYLCVHTDAPATTGELQKSGKVQGANLLCINAYLQYRPLLIIHTIQLTPKNQSLMQLMTKKNHSSVAL